MHSISLDPAAAPWGGSERKPAEGPRGHALAPRKARAGTLGAQAAQGPLGPVVLGVALGLHIPAAPAPRFQLLAPQLYHSEGGSRGSGVGGGGGGGGGGGCGGCGLSSEFPI